MSVRTYSLKNGGRPTRSRSLGSRAPRRGVAAVLGVVLTVSLVALMAFTMDFGTIHVSQSEMRRTADAAAMSACWELFDHQANNDSDFEVCTIEAADAVAYLNTVGRDPMQFGSNDVEIGTYRAHLPDQFDTSDPSQFNAVRVTLLRQEGVNGELPLFFGSLTGRDSQSLNTTATAAMLHAIEGFYVPRNADENLGIMPIALDLPSWLDVENKRTVDSFDYSGGGYSGGVGNGSDGLFETNLYPEGTGLPGNRGTVDIGGANNSTDDLARQLLHGISAQDLADLGQPLKFDSRGKLDLNGDTGISAGIKDELASLIGKVRMIPIYDYASGNGNNAMFTIVRWEGIRILDVQLTGKPANKRVIIQPAKVIARGAIIDKTGESYSSHVVTPVMLVQ
jgi:hypothetical protein